MFKELLLYTLPICSVPSIFFLDVLAFWIAIFPQLLVLKYFWKKNILEYFLLASFVSILKKLNL